MSKISTETLREVLDDSLAFVRQVRVIKRDFKFEKNASYVFVGIRRAGKSYLLFQRMQELASQGVPWEKFLYVNFEDERLIGLQANDLNRLLECHYEKSDEEPILFLDEIQNIDGWEKFVRRMTDTKRIVHVTGSNAKMLSRDVATTLGGRLFVKEIFPYSFPEFLTAKHFDFSKLEQTTANRGKIKRLFKEYFYFGGFPESLLYQDKRGYISSVYQKIYLGDIAARNSLGNVNTLQIVIKKIAESIKQPISFNRITNVVNSIGCKVGINKVIEMINGAVDSELLQPVRNISAKLSEKESKPKYYFTDNGLLNLFLSDPDSSLHENLVAVSLLRLYGRENVFFHNSVSAEVDFYVPDASLAIQASLEILSQKTEAREISALIKFNKYCPCKKNQIITLDTEDSITAEGLKIELIPLWKFLFSNCSTQ